MSEVGNNDTRGPAEIMTATSGSSDGSTEDVPVGNSVDLESDNDNDNDNENETSDGNFREEAGAMDKDVEETEIVADQSEATTTKELENRLKEQETKVNDQLYNLTSPKLPPRQSSVVESSPSVTNDPTDTSQPKPLPVLPPRDKNVGVSAAQPTPPQLPYRDDPNKLPIDKSIPPQLPFRENPNGETVSKHEDKEEGFEVISNSTCAKNLILNRMKDTIEILTLIDKYKKNTGKITEENDLWNQIIENPELVIDSKYDDVQNELIYNHSLPDELRNNIWNSITFTNLHNWDNVYDLLLSKKSSTYNETEIRDCIKNFKANQLVSSEENNEIIFNVLKSYLNLDPEIQFTEELLFILLPILPVFENNELRTFTQFCVIMKHYNFRQFFLMDEFNDLSLLIYQFDRILEENCEEIYNHLLKQGIKSTMFVNDWIKTLFGKLNLPIDQQLIFFDLIFFYGIEIMLSFVFTILIKNEKAILNLEDDQLLLYLKSVVEPFIIYRVGDENNDTSHLKHYDIEQFIIDSIELITLTPVMLNKFSIEFTEIYSSENAMKQEFSKIKKENILLQNDVKKLEHDYTLLNREHVTIANELLQNQIKINNYTKENSDLKLKSLEIKRQLEKQIAKNKEDAKKAIPQDMTKELDTAMKRNASVMQSNLILQDKISELENVVAQLKDANSRETYIEELSAENSNALLKNPVIGGSWNGIKSVFK